MDTTIAKTCCTSIVEIRLELHPGVVLIDAKTNKPTALVLLEILRELGDRQSGSRLAARRFNNWGVGRLL